MPVVDILQSIFLPERRVNSMAAPNIKRKKRFRLFEPEPARINAVYIGKQMGMLVETIRIE